MNARDLAALVGGDADPVTAEEPTVKLGNRKYIVLHQGTQYIVDGDRCSCGHQRDPDIDLGTPPKTAYKERLKASCEHQKIVKQADPTASPCPDCGCYVADREPLSDERNSWLLTKWECSNCGVERYV